MKSKHYQDILGGLALVALGAFAALYAQQYEMGDLNRMGPGYFPVALGTLLAVLGLFIAVPAFFRGGPAIQLAWKSFITVVLSIVLFAFALKPLGLLLATSLSVLVASLADHDIRWKGRLAVAAGVSLVTYVIFILGLSMVLPVWPWSL